MCKIHKAIYELAKHVNSDILVCTTGNLHFEGQLHKCNWGEDNNACYEDIITLKNVKVSNYDNMQTREYEWVNIASSRINAFSFKNCIKSE